tara:strand:+ start:165 stop:389 length:225 start_codon:yes stop_codon:yes gene_type:complete
MGDQPVIKQTKEELLVIIDHLLKEIEILNDENKSLWGMLDEIHESDKAAKKLTDEQREKAMLEFLKNMKPVGDA